MAEKGRSKAGGGAVPSLRTSDCLLYLITHYICKCSPVTQMRKLRLRVPVLNNHF